jgi:hypothetical protein
MHFELEAGRPASSIADENAARVSSASKHESRSEHLHAAELISPALVPWKRGDASAYELKFLLDEEKSRQVEALLASHLAHDPFGQPELGSAYRINTVYCDTPAFDVYHAVGNFRRRKFRLRSYSAESLVYLERKTKVGQRVRKKRSPVATAELATLSRFHPHADWSGDWFHRQLLHRRLNPVCCVSYLRTAYVGSGAEGPIRLTFDRELSGFATSEWLPSVGVKPISFLAGQVVCEFKFRGTMPPLFKSAIQSLQLTPGGNSKYRHCLQAAAIDTTPAGT